VGRLSYPERLGNNTEQASRHGEFIRLYLAGNDVHQIAKQEHRDPETVMRVLRKKFPGLYGQHRGGRGKKAKRGLE